MCPTSGHVLLASADVDVDYRDVAAQKVLLRERIAGLGWLTPDILAHLDDRRLCLDVARAAEPAAGRHRAGRRCGSIRLLGGAFWLGGGAVTSGASGGVDR